MKKYFLALFFCLVAGPAWSQCNGVFGANQVCATGASPGIPTATAPISTAAGGTGGSSFTANLPVIGNGSGALAQGTRSGSTTIFATSTGTLTNGHCVSIDGSGNFIDAGGSCTTGAGGGTVSSASQYNIGYYATAGTVISGNTTITTDASNDLIAPVHAGGSGTGSTLTLESTTGAGATDLIKFQTASQTERMRIDSNGNIITGGSASVASLFGDVPGIQLNYSSSAGLRAIASLAGWTNTAGSPGLYFSKSRGTTIGAQTIVQNNDTLGYIGFGGSDGAALQIGAAIQAAVDGTPAANSVPTRFQFFTGSNGAGTERLRIDSGGHVTIGGFAAFANGFGATPNLQIIGGTGSASGEQIGRFSADSNAGVLYFLKSRNVTIGSNTAVSVNDQIGFFEFEAADATAGSLLQESANIIVSADAAPTAGSVAGRIAFATSASGSGNAVERLRIDSTGHSLFTAGSPNPASGVNTFAVVTTQSFGGGYGWVDNSGVWGEWTSSSGAQLNIGFAANGSTGLTTTAFFQNTTALSLTPPGSSLDMALSTGQTGHGTVSADNCTDCYDGIYTLNAIDVGSDDINLPSATGAGVAALAIAVKWGGSNAHGERSPLYISSQWTANDATVSNPDGANNVGATIIAQSNINAGGGGVNAGRGGNWALNPKCLMGASSVNMSTCAGAEVNLEVLSGASVDNKIGWYIITTAGDAVQGRTINDAAYAFMADGSVGFKCGYCASDLFTSKSPIASGGTFLGSEFASGPYTIAIGLDLTGFQNMTYQIKGKTFGIDGSGNLGAAGYVIVNGSLGVVATGVTCTAGSVNAATFTANNGIVTHC